MNKKKALSSGELYRKYGIVIIMIILFVASAVINHNFLKPQNLLNILKQISVVTIIACGETMLIVSGMIDLSAGFLCTTSACVSAGVLASTGHLSLALLVGIVIGCVCGWINGFLITYYKLQPFIATLAMTYVLKGIVQIYTNGQTIGGVNKARFLGHGSILGIPVPVLIMLLSVIVIAVLMKSTKFGTYIYAIGGNEQATIASGINTNRTKRLIFTLSGALTGLAGVVLMARLMAGMPSVGEGYEFDAITAVIVGGTSFLGGIGTVTGALIGSIIVGLINNILNLLHVSTQYTVKVTFTVKNTGEYDGAEVAQLYFSDKVASMVRPTKELAGFVRIFLKKGEKKKVVFEIKVSQFAFLDEEMKWKVEKGEIELLAGSSCEDIRLSDIVSISEDDYIDGKTRGFYAKAVVC